jgi:hypothetical protein
MQNGRIRGNGSISGRVGGEAAHCDADRRWCEAVDGRVARSRAEEEGDVMGLGLSTFFHEGLVVGVDQVGA